MRVKLLFFLIFSQAYMLQSQVLINEYSASNLNNFLDNFGKTEDWIELYNTTNQPIDLGGWYLSDKEDKPTKWEIPAGTTIDANGFLVFWCSGRDMVVSGNYHTNFKLTQTKGNEYVVLTNPNWEVVDIQTVKITMVEHSNCRAVDGGTDFVVCTQPTLGGSNNGSEQFKRYTSIPVIDRAAGFYQGSVEVNIANTEPNSELHYTTDGTNPTLSSPVYNGPLTINNTTVVKALAFSNDPEILPGMMSFATYFIDESFTLPVFSVAADDVQGLANGDGSLIPIGSLEYFDAAGNLKASSFGSLNRHGQDSWVLNHRSLDWVSRDEMGHSKAVEAKLFNYSDRDEYQRFMFRASGDDNYPAIDDFEHEGSTHIRDEYVHALAQNGGMKLDVRAVERCIVFLNGDYWGVYGLRERPVDHDYTEYYYNQDKYHIQYLTTWGDTDIEYGGPEAKAEWLALRDFILESDMSVTGNYEKVKDQMQVLSLCDYMIANLNSVASDWLNYNTGWWRGIDPNGDHKKWGYILWDNDATFDYYINYSGVPETSPYAEPCDINEIADFMDEFFYDYTPPTLDTIEEAAVAMCPTIIGGDCPYPSSDPVLGVVMATDSYCCEVTWDQECQDLYNSVANGDIYTNGDPSNVGSHEKIFLKLQEENEEFRQLYYSRQADLMNTVYSCENMLQTLDSMVAVIAPEMPRQIQRWGGSISEWEQNLNELREFVELRCQLLDDGMMDCFELTGPYSLTVQVEPPLAGDVKINTLWHSDFPWSGDYFGGMNNLLKAKETGMLNFDHWESKSGQTIIANPFEKEIQIELTQADTLVAHFTNVVGTSDVENGGIQLDLLPNPSSGQVTAKFTLSSRTENTELSIFDLYGRKVYTNSLSNTTLSDFISIDLSKLGLAKGMYMVELKTEKGRSVKSLVFE